MNVAAEPTRPGRFAHWVIPLIVLATTALVIAMARGQIFTAATTMQRADGEWMLFALLLVPVGIAARAAETWFAYRAVGAPATMLPMLRVSATSYTANKVVRGGGLPGLGIHLQDGRQRGAGRHHVVAAYCATRLTTVFGLMLLLFVAGPVVAIGHAVHVNPLPLAAGACLAVMMALLAAPVWRPSEALLPTVEPLDGVPTAGPRRRWRTWLRDGRDALAAMRRNPRRLFPAAACGLASRFVGAATLIAVLVALGLHVSALTVVGVYLVGAIASALGPLPGGIGFTEASIVAVLRRGGAGSTPALTAAVSFRLLDLWIPIVVGAVAWLVLARSRAETRST